jgi:hypothetical protein
MIIENGREIRYRVYICLWTKDKEKEKKREQTTPKKNRNKHFIREGKKARQKRSSSPLSPLAHSSFASSSLQHSAPI